MRKKLKQLPVLKSDQEAEDFVAHADLSEYDLSHFEVVQFEFGKKDARITMRLSEALLNAVRERAQRRGGRHRQKRRTDFNTSLALTSSAQLRPAGGRRGGKAIRRSTSSSSSSSSSNTIYLSIYLSTFPLHSQ
jgi:predicted DNA binding CopG/RHH family protein